MGLIKDLLGIQTADEQARTDYYKDRGLSEQAQRSLVEAKIRDMDRKSRGQYTEEELSEMRAKDAESSRKNADIAKINAEAGKTIAERSKLDYENTPEFRQAMADRQIAERLKISAEAGKIGAEADEQTQRVQNMQIDRKRVEEAVYMQSELAKSQAEESARNAMLKQSMASDPQNKQLFAEVAASNARLDFIGNTMKHHQNVAMLSLGNQAQYQSAVPQYFAAQFGYKDNEGAKQANDQAFKGKYFEVETTTGGGTTGEPQNKIKAYLPIEQLKNFAGSMPNGAMGAQGQAESIDYMRNAFPSGNAQYPIGQTGSDPIQQANYAASGGSTMFTPEPVQPAAPKRWVFDPTTGGMKLQNP